MAWIEEFLAAASRRGVRPRTVELYGFLLRRMLEHHQVDLQSCSREELVKILDHVRSERSPRYYILHVIVVKMALQWLKRKELAESIEFPKRPDPAGAIKVISEDDIHRLIQEAPTLKDRLLIEILYETGARRGELAALRMQDIQFDEHSAILHLTGKTGTRRRRAYLSVPDLRAYLNEHPKKGDPDARLFLTDIGTPLGDVTLYRRIQRLTKKILGREIHPHQFRHTRATMDSRMFTDREMMLLFGWKRPDMVSVYSHLSMRDVDEKDLALHGKRIKEDVLRPVIQLQRCVECGTENAPVSMYCSKCGGILGGVQIQEVRQALEDKNKLLEDRLAKLEAVQMERLTVRKE